MNWKFKVRYYFQKSTFNFSVISSHKTQNKLNSISLALFKCKIRWKSRRKNADTAETWMRWSIIRSRKANSRLSSLMRKLSPTINKQSFFAQTFLRKKERKKLGKFRSNSKIILEIISSFQIFREKIKERNSETCVKSEKM